MARNIVKFNIRGTRFETIKDTLQKTPGTVLYDLDSLNNAYDDVNKEYFFDRDPEVFNIILNYFNHGKLHVPKNICGALLREELKFWSVPHSHVADCCWRAFYAHEEEQDVLEDLRKANTDILYAGKHVNKTTARYKLWMLLDNPGSSLHAKVTNQNIFLDLYKLIYSYSTNIRTVLHRSNKNDGLRSSAN